MSRPESSAARAAPQPPTNRFAADVSRPGRAGQRVLWLRPAVPATNPPAASTAATCGSAARAVLAEIRQLAAAYVAGGPSARVDLRPLAAVPGERAQLEDLLGRGEVEAVVAALGRSELRETAIPCLWWVRHFDDDGALRGEAIEIAEVPEILAGDRQATVAALDALYAGLAVGAPRLSDTSSTFTRSSS